MVVNKKPAAAPGVGSRTNSYQTPTSKAAKPKDKSPLAQTAGSSSPSKAEPTNGSLPNVTSKSSSWFSSNATAKSKSKKGRKKRASGLKSASWMDKAIMFLLSLFVLYTVTTCPSDKHLQDPTCKALHLYRTRVIEPYFLPPFYNALQHPSVQPYIEKASQFQERAAPVVAAVDKRARPYARYAKILAWDRALVPIYYRHIIPQYEAHVVPQLLQLLGKVEPYLGPAYSKASSTVEQTRTHAFAAYDTTYPHVYKAYTLAKPHAQWAYEQGKPYALQAYEFTRAKSAEGYEAAKPYAFIAYQKALEYFKIILAELVSLRRQYVDKHVGDIWDKVVELSGSKSEGSVSASITSLASSATSLASSASSVASVASETVAEAIHSTASTVSKAVVESIVSVTESASSIVEAATPSPSEAVESTPPAVSVDSTPAAEKTVVPAEESPSDGAVDLDLDDFLANLGISVGEDAVAKPSVIAVEEHDEQRPNSDLTTAEKREKIKARHADWFKQLNDLYDTEAVFVRDTLINVRASAAKALFDKSPESDAIDSALGISDEDKKIILYTDGVRVSRVMDVLTAEGNMLLAGLDGWLKKEESDLQARDDAPTVEELQKKEMKWMDVLQKVENKFYASVSGIQEKVHAWFTAVRDLEIRECLESTMRVKRFAERAQADLGLDYTWLEDVTVKDWRAYHDLLNLYTDFDTEVRQLQNGTHVDPVEDPVVPSLDKLQAELQDVISGFSARARTLNHKALQELFAVPETETATSDPEVSILPIETEDQSKAGSEGEFDGSQILVGKDAAQIEQVLKDIPVEAARHEEL